MAEGLRLLVRMAWRNLWRSPRRTFLTALGLGLGLALLLVSLGLGDGAHEQMIANGVQLGSGHVVVQAHGYQETRAQDLLLPAAVVSATELFLRSQENTETFQGIRPRLVASGLLSSAANAAGVGLLGVVPERERTLSLVPRRMLEGAYLESETQGGMVIGAELARKLEVRVGSRVVLMTQAVRRQGSTLTPEGALHSTLFRITGIFRTGLHDVDAYTVHLPLAQLQDLLRTPHQVTQVAIFLTKVDAAPRVAVGLRAHLSDLGVEVLTWQEAMAELADFVRLDDAFGYVTNAIVLAMVGLGLLNTVLMAVLERRYEFGVCLALGLRPGQLAGIVMGESLVLAAISLVSGLAVGFSIHQYFATSGLDMHWFTDVDLSTAGTVFDPVLYSRLSLSRIVWSLTIVFGMAAVLSIYPALKAARTDLPESLRVW